MIDNGSHVVLLSSSGVMYAGAAPDAAKIETQGRNTEPHQRFGGGVHHLAVHGAAEQRMRVAYDGCRMPGRDGRRALEKTFDPPGRAGKAEILDTLHLRQIVACCRRDAVPLP